VNETVRRLNDHGLREFSAWIQSLREGGKALIPSGLLTDPISSEPIGFDATAVQKNFGSRYELGAALVATLTSAEEQAVSRDIGLWSWLALYYFDLLAPADAGGHRNPRMTYTYILSGDFRHHTRHAIRTTWQLVSLYGERSRFMLSKEPSQRGEIIEQLAARQELFSCPAVIEAASELYQEPDSGSFKRGAAGRGRGSVSRLIKVLQQFQLTYDLFSMSGGELSGLLPAEFDRFKSV
jgi:hypothetical protein